MSDRGEGREAAHGPGEPKPGVMLVAHPSLKDPSFRRTVILIATHSPEVGTVGVILNRARGGSLGSVEARFALGPLAEVPLYCGGPVNGSNLTFAFWKWRAAGRRFHLHFGADREMVEKMLSEDPEIRVRGFLGHAAWAPGQLKRELEGDAWRIVPMDAGLFSTLDGVPLWRGIAGKISPSMRLLCEAPEKPESN